MNGITTLIIITIAIIGIIAIIIVKLYYKEDKTYDISLNDIKYWINSKFNSNKTNTKQVNKPSSLRKSEAQNSVANLFNQNKQPVHEDIYSVEINEPTIYSASKEEVPMTQEPITESQKEILKSNEEKVEKSNLKELFTIDELIEESKRKDVIRNNQSSISKEKQENEIKESISKKMIEEESNKKEIIEQPTIEPVTKEQPTIEPVTKEQPNSFKEISNLENPTKISDLKSDNMSIYEYEEEEDLFDDLDYRKDIEKIKNTLKNSKLLSNVKNKIIPDLEEENYETNEEFIKSVNNPYDEIDYEPIYNETHESRQGIAEEPVYEPVYDNNISEEEFEQKLREENTRKVMNMAHNSDNQVKTEESLNRKNKDTINIILNNEKVKLNTGDEIVFKVDGDTYISNVNAIRGNDIYVRYRGKNITIKENEIKKIY